MVKFGIWIIIVIAFLFGKFIYSVHDSNFEFEQNQKQKFVISNSDILLAYIKVKSEISGEYDIKLLSNEIQSANLFLIKIKTRETLLKDNIQKLILNNDKIISCIKVKNRDMASQLLDENIKIHNSIFKEIILEKVK